MTLQRTFIPGSEWLFFKIYSGAKTADELLIRTLHPYLTDLLDRNAIDNWFFIRYADPDFHIRFRLHIPDPADYAEVFRQFTLRFQPEVESGAIAKIMCDTYVREIERYGADSITTLETLFGIDSRLILQLLGRLADLPEEQRETFRWRTALLLLDDNLTAFGCAPADKLRITARMAESYKQEFGFTVHAFTKQLNDKFRSLRREIERTLATREDFAPYEPLLQQRRAQMQSPAACIAELRAAGASVPPADDLLFSVQHMTMNRWFRSRNRQYELVIYDFLNKFYDSAQAKAQRNLSAKPEKPENPTTE